jgi:alanine racemase
MFFRPTWAEVDLSVLESNIRRLRSRVGRGVKLLFVVKANAYGHGAVACAKRAQKARLADWLGVSSVEEGVTLRESGVKLPILVLGSLYPFESFLAGVEHRLTPTVASVEAARRLAQAARQLGRAVDCHLKVDTGMGRIGMSPAALEEAVRFLSLEPRVRVQGVYTHLACAESDAAYTRAQLKRFKSVLPLVSSPLVHSANSAAALKYPESRFDMVRPGLACYGLYPGFSPVLSLKSKIVFLKTVPKGAAVSYGATWRARGRRRLATIPVGYADGLPRRLSNKGEVLIGGKRCPIVGAVTMDMLMVDATGAPSARVGDDVVLLGRQGREEITAGELAKTLGTIPYEITTAISSRVPRVFLS